MTKKNYIKIVKRINQWEAENTFYLKATPERISKFMAHYEIFNKVKKLKGDIVECGVFRGASLSRFMNFNKIFKSKKKFFAFDAFGKFPNSGTKEDKAFSVKHNKSGYGIKKKDLENLLNKNFNNYTLYEGDILKTLNLFLKKKRKISLLHLDLDVYKATKYVLENLYPFIVKNGIILIDDYKHIPNTTKAINQFIKKNKKLKISRFDFPCRPSYMIKN